MRCERCGKELTNRIIKINGITYCDNCARLMGYDRYLREPSDILGNPFAPLDQIASSLLQMSELDFGNSALSCPKCGMSLRDFERKGRLGCIECYNTFNESVMRLLMRLQADNHYRGRTPGIASEPLDDIKETREVDATEIGSNIETKEAESAPSKEIVADENKLLKYSNADIGMLTNEDLNEAIKLAVANEDYLLAAKFRDELRSREGV